MYARLTNSFGFGKARGNSKKKEGASSTVDSSALEQQLITRTQSIIDDDIQLRGKLHLTYNAIKKKLISEFDAELYEKCKPFVQDIIKQAAPRESRAAVSSSNSFSAHVNAGNVARPNATVTHSADIDMKNAGSTAMVKQTIYKGTFSCFLLFFHMKS